jgi:hypothetical protein
VSRTPGVTPREEKDLVHFVQGVTFPPSVIFPDPSPELKLEEKGSKFRTYR